MFQIRTTIFVISSLFLIATYWMVRRKKLKTSYALLWLGTAATMMLFTISPKMLQWLSQVTGLYYLTALLLLCFVFLLILFLHFSTVISNLVYQNRMLGERIAFLEKKMLDLDS